MIGRMVERAMSFVAVAMVVCLGLGALVQAATADAPLPLAPRFATSAQLLTTTPDKKVQWDQGVAAGVTLANVNAYQWTAYFDAPPQGPVAGTGLHVTASCTGATPPFVCTMSQTIGALVGTTGTHRLILAAQASNGDGTFTAEVRSAECSFRFDTSPTAPANLRFVSLDLAHAAVALLM